MQVRPILRKQVSAEGKIFVFVVRHDCSTVLAYAYTHEIYIGIVLGNEVWLASRTLLPSYPTNYERYNSVILIFCLSCKLFIAVTMLGFLTLIRKLRTFWLNGQGSQHTAG